MEPGYHKREDLLFSAHVHIPGGPSPQIDGYLDTASDAGHNAERGMAPEKGLIHKDPSVWGTGVDNFNPRRFMKDEVQ